MHKLLVLMIISITPLVHCMHSPDPVELISKITYISKHEDCGRESYEASLGPRGKLGVLHAGCNYRDDGGAIYCELAQMIDGRYVQTEFDRRLFRLVKRFFDFIPVQYTTRSNDRFNPFYQEVESDFIYTGKKVTNGIVQEFFKTLNKHQ